MYLNTANDWDHRFSQQAQWTKDIRAHLFERIKLPTEGKVLDIGCGTGVILKELDKWGLTLFGVDIDSSFLNFAIKAISSTSFAQGDAHHLPYPDDTFNASMCHFLLLWVENPKLVLEEMTRVTKPGGYVLALAEPDYGGRIDHPRELAALGEWQTESLQHQGADPLMGRQLSSLLTQAGLNSVETGVLGGQWSGSPDWDAWNSEWCVLESDMAKAPGIFQTERISKLKDTDRNAHLIGERVLYVPTFYAWGIVR